MIAQPQHKVNVAIIYLKCLKLNNNCNSKQKSTANGKTHHFISFHLLASKIQLACEPNFTTSQNKI